MFYSLTRVSRNQKLGPMPAATSARRTCPTSCALKEGCYAAYGPMSIFWSKVDRGEAGGEFDQFVRDVERLPKQQIWRYGQAGDLPGEGDKIDREQLLRLAKANRGRPVIAYTHKPATQENLAVLREAKKAGFPVNLSANNVSQADELLGHDLNVVVVLPEIYQKRKDESQGEFKRRLDSLPKHTPGGKRIAVCPATYSETNCLSCRVCAASEPRNAVIGFPAHGTKRGKVSQIAGQTATASMVGQV